MRTALVVGTGLIGTSVALALHGRGVQVYLADHDPDQAETAAALGAGTAAEPPGPVDLAVVAVPPAHVAPTLAAVIRRGAARAYLDVASVKGGPRRELEAMGCDLTAYLGTHPMAGKERSGPLAATADLFEGRPWVLTPAEGGDTEVLNLALELVALCRAVPVVMEAEAHDRAVALVSHTPQLVSSLVAARLQDADETAVRLCGQGIRDVTRIAGSAPRMWMDILAANPGPVADVLGEVSADLERTVRALRALQAADEDKRAEGARGVEDVLVRGNAGRERVPGKHGAAPAAYEIVAVHIGDQPGELARIFSDAGRAAVNIEDVRIEHATGQQAGFIQLMVEPQAAPILMAELRERGWSIRQ
ncbi:prephenate dehydrogenase [Streptomyces sp. NPDC045470]|uniref:prephenate dehydrogenase n=1 Tax=unclassified Streptomyces TaxID=2593676 RepID=UPI0033CC0DAA